MMKQLIKYLSVLIFLLVYQDTYAQCDWDIYIAPASITASSCAKNGGFAVTLTGSSASSLTSVAYSAAGPTTINSNSSSVYTEMSAGTYTVKVTAICPMGGGETKTKTVIIPGNYIPPSTPAYTVKRNALDCGDFGRILLTSITGSAKPYKIKMTAKPASYLGPTEFITSNNQYQIDDLSAGNYSFLLEDACNTGTAEVQVVIKELVLDNAPITLGKFYAPSAPNVLPCNVVGVVAPTFSNTDWIGYSAGDSPLEYAVSIDGGAESAWFQLRDTPRPDITLPAGTTPKDYYSKNNFGKATIRVKSNPTCMISSNLETGEFKTHLSTNINKNCSDFSIKYGPYANFIICYPVSINLKKSGDPIGTNYLLNYSDGNIITNALSFGTYTATYTTADNYTWTRTITVNAPSTKPYSVIIYPNVSGLHGYLGRFRIQRENNDLITIGTKIELVKAPPGYSYSYTYKYLSAYFHDVSANQSVPQTSPLFWYIAGDYTWRITDLCGVYDVDITILESDIHKYTLDVSNQTRTCNSLTVKPTGTYTYKDATTDANFRIISGPVGFPSAVIPPGGSFVLTTPGEYEIMALASDEIANHFPYARRSEKIVYVNDPIKINDAVSQGFACVGTADNEGQISIRAMGGSGNYTYNLYASLSNAQNNTGLLSSNTTGDFPPTLGLMKDQIYYVKMIDDCGGYTIQPITIMNLKDTKIILVNSPNICEGGELRLNALVLPSGNYSWVGPNGFTSLLHNPIRNNMSFLDAGDYIVTIQSGYCGLDTKDTITIAVLARPNPLVIANNMEVCHKSTPQPLTATPDPDCSIQWFSSDGISPIAGTPSPSTTTLGTIEYWVRQINTITNCTSDKQKITIHIVNTCITAVDDTISVLACGKVSFDPTINDIFIDGNANLSITFGTPTQGTVSNSGTNTTYTNTLCVKGKDEFTYTVCKDNDGSCSTAKISVHILAMPEIIMLQNCSFTPKIGIDLQYKDAVYTWERSDDGTSNWTPISANFVLDVISEGYYRVKIKIPGLDEAISTVKQVKVKTTIMNNLNWYDIWFE